MISLTCTHCSATLTMDDAFAGGVCRCQHCGTIQTVPVKDAANGAKGGSPGAAQQQKALYQRRGRAAAEPAGSGLDELADIVASSGLSNLSNRANRPATIARPGEPAIPQHAERQNLTPLLIGGGAVIAVVLGLIAWLIVNGNRNTGGRELTDTPTTTGGRTSGEPDPTFVTIPLQGNNVVYVVDCGQAAHEFFGLTKDAVLRSARSLGTGRRFQVVFWDNGTGVEVTPSIPSSPSDRTLEQVRQKMDNVFAQGQSDPELALKKAFSVNPTDVVIITAKGTQLDEPFVEMTEAVRKAGPGAKVHTVSLGPDAEDSKLKRIASHSGGTYLVATQDDLRAFAG